MRRYNAAQAHWTNILFPWQVFIKDKDGDKINWTNLFLPWSVFAKKQEGTVEPLQSTELDNTNNAQNNQTVYILIALAIGLGLAFLIAKR